MTVTELIELLQKIENKNVTVLMSIDPEGNGYREFSGDIDETLYREDGYDTEIFDQEAFEIDWLDDPDVSDEEAADYKNDFKPCIVLWP